MRTAPGAPPWNCSELRLSALLSACLATAALAAAPARAGPAVVGPPETVFDWAAARCATWDIPDTPARAWRGADGRVRLVAGSEESRASVGPSLGALARDCAVLWRARGADDPGAYDDRGWIARHLFRRRPAGDGARARGVPRASAPRPLPLRGLPPVLAQCDRGARVRGRRPELSARGGGGGGRSALSLFRRRRASERILQSQQHPARAATISTSSSWRSGTARSGAGPACCAGRSRVARRTGGRGTARASTSASSTPIARTWPTRRATSARRCAGCRARYRAWSRAPRPGATWR